MKMRDSHPFDQVFTHIAEDGAVTHVNSGAIVRYVDENGLTIGFKEVQLGLLTHQVSFIIKSREITDFEYCRRRAFESIHKPFPYNCVICVEFSDKTVNIVDGNHRLVGMYEMGAMSTPAIIAGVGAWERFIIEDMPEALHNLAVKSALPSMK